MPPLHTLLNSQPVQWKTLGEVADYQQPTQYLVSSKDYSDDYPTPVLTAGKTFILGYTDETHGIYNASQKPVIIFDDFTTANKWVDFDFKVKSSAMKMLTSKDESQVLLKFIYYYLNSLPSVEISDHKRQWISNFAQKPFPVLPLPLQARIVEILDNFTACNEQLTAALNKEHNLRKKQYAHYRDLLLSEAELSKVGFEWKALGEVCQKICSGGTPTAGRDDFYQNGNIPWLRTQEVKFNEIFDTEVKITPLALEKSSAKWIPENCVIVAISGATAGRVAINKIPLTTNQHCCNLQINPEIALYKYVFYWISREFENIKSLGQGARSGLNSGIIKNYPIPLAHQHKIVEILDRFDTLTNSITQGLPREIELRRKQYEYYRELLLTLE